MEQQKLKLFEERPILSVTQIVEGVKSQLEAGFCDIWVRGEISNFRTPPSGHLYFTLKDSKSQLKAVCFRMRSRLLKFRPEDGMEVIARGSLSVYAPRGDFQLVIESVEPVGPGALQIAFEKLKTQLQSEGLFDEAHKKKLPLLPAKVGVVTSPSGAAVQDILRVLSRRNDRLNILIFPALVQGSGAALQIIQGIDYLNSRQDIDVIILTRGGGSLEDLWAFNEEPVARAIFESRLPVISAVGHEIDFTIADFVADLRAPTPSAAAEIVSGARIDLWNRVEGLVLRCGQALRLHITYKRQQLQKLAASRAFVDAESRLRFFLQRLDELHTRLLKTLPTRLEPLRERVAQHSKDLSRQIQFYLRSKRQSHKSQADQLQAFSPQAVLDRGYAIATSEKNQVIRSPDQLKKGDKLGVQVARGGFRAQKI